MATLPESPSILGHIFRQKKGHLADTAENRALLVAVANDSAAWKVSDRYGNVWSYRLLSDGTEVWVQAYNDMIFNGGVNATPTRAWEAKR